MARKRPQARPDLPTEGTFSASDKGEAAASPATPRAAENAPPATPATDPSPAPVKVETDHPLGIVVHTF